MKRHILIIGLILCILNFIAFVVIEPFGSIAFSSSGLNLVISTLLMFFLAKSSYDSVFKIVGTFGFVLTGVLRFIISFFVVSEISYRYGLFFFSVVLAFEFLCLVAFSYLTKKT